MSRGQVRMALEEGLINIDNFNAKETTKPFRRTLVSRLAFCVGASVLLWGAIGIQLYVLPATDAPKNADVLFVLAPAGDRMEQAGRLMDQGFGETLAISFPLGQADNPDPAICNESRAYRIVCFSPDPVTTQGEARALRLLSREHSWKSANVLTMQSHITRARLILERCYEEDLRMVAHWQKLPVLSLESPQKSWAYRYAYETAAFIKVALNQDC